VEGCEVLGSSVHGPFTLSSDDLFTSAPEGVEKASIQDTTGTTWNDPYLMRHTPSPRRRLGARALVPALAAAPALLVGFLSAPLAAADDIVDDPPVLVSAAIRDGKPIDGIPAGPMVAGGYHVHAHLTLYVDGTEMWVPAGVGVLHPVVLDPDHPDPVITAAKAFYWLHTH